MGPTGPSARRAPYFFFFLAAFFFFAIVSPPSAPRVPRFARSWGRLYGEPAKGVKEKIHSGGGSSSRSPHIWGRRGATRELTTASGVRDGVRTPGSAPCPFCTLDTARADTWGSRGSRD